ncbi:MAG TPA: hypothetical protein VJZ00_19600 [Thermoanaerobaculia bacterium]|nr:hypothetical protein [Thermoanaerobaculia bacterium]
MPRNVTIVFDPAFEGLDALAFRSPVWIVDTPANRTSAETVNLSAVEWPHISVTVFRPPESTKEDWRTLLEQIAIHERTIDAIDVLGAPLTLVARAALAESGLTKFEETESGFRARRA